LKDKFGVSWQIIPTILDKMLQDKDSKKVARVTQAFLQMKKFDIEALKGDMPQPRKSENFIHSTSITLKG
jgi:hypothetical protein